MLARVLTSLLAVTVLVFGCEEATPVDGRASSKDPTICQCTETFEPISARAWLADYEAQDRLGIVWLMSRGQMIPTLGSYQPDRKHLCETMLELSHKTPCLTSMLYDEIRDTEIFRIEIDARKKELRAEIIEHEKAKIQATADRREEEKKRLLRAQERLRRD